jgi:hypothetical protein
VKRSIERVAAFLAQEKFPIVLKIDPWAGSKFHIERTCQSQCHWRERI